MRPISAEMSVRSVAGRSDRCEETRAVGPAQGEGCVDRPTERRLKNPVEERSRSDDVISASGIRWFGMAHMEVLEEEDSAWTERSCDLGEEVTAWVLEEGSCGTVAAVDTEQKKRQCQPTDVHRERGRLARTYRLK